jgi:hypothetical protein
MKFEIIAHGNTSQGRIDLLKNSAKFYAKKLNLLNLDYKVLIYSEPNLRKNDGNNGVACKTGQKEITIMVDSKLKLPHMLITLAHEMVHAKQYVRGQYRAEWARNGKVKKLWLGRPYSVAYLKRPWEREAFRREGELALALLESVAQKKKKKKSSS